MASVWVGNLHPDITEDEIIKLFSRFGPFRLKNLRLNPKHNKKYCFLNFKHESSAKAAVQDMKGKIYRGLPLAMNIQNDNHSKKSETEEIENMELPFDNLQMNFLHKIYQKDILTKATSLYAVDIQGLTYNSKVIIMKGTQRNMEEVRDLIHSYLENTEYREIVVPKGLEKQIKEMLNTDIQCVGRCTPAPQNMYKYKLFGTKNDVTTILIQIEEKLKSMGFKLPYTSPYPKQMTSPMKSQMGSQKKYQGQNIQKPMRGMKLSWSNEPIEFKAEGLKILRSKLLTKCFDDLKQRIASQFIEPVDIKWYTIDKFCNDIIIEVFPPNAKEMVEQEVNQWIIKEVTIPISPELKRCLQEKNNYHRFIDFATDYYCNFEIPKTTNCIIIRSLSEEALKKFEKEVKKGLNLEESKELNNPEKITINVPKNVGLFINFLKKKNEFKNLKVKIHPSNTEITIIKYAGQDELVKATIDFIKSIEETERTIKVRAMKQTRERFNKLKESIENESNIKIRYSMRGFDNPTKVSDVTMTFIGTPKELQKVDDIVNKFQKIENEMKVYDFQNDKAFKFIENKGHKKYIEEKYNVTISSNKNEETVIIGGEDTNVKNAIEYLSKLKKKIIQIPEDISFFLLSELSKEQDSLEKKKVKYVLQNPLQIIGEEKEVDGICIDHYIKYIEANIKFDKIPASSVECEEVIKDQKSIKQIENRTGVQIILPYNGLVSQLSVGSAIVKLKFGEYHKEKGSILVYPSFLIEDLKVIGGPHIQGIYDTTKIGSFNIIESGFLNYRNIYLLHVAPSVALDKLIISCLENAEAEGAKSLVIPLDLFELIYQENLFTPIFDAVSKFLRDSKKIKEVCFISLNEKVVEESKGVMKLASGIDCSQYLWSWYNEDEGFKLYEPHRNAALNRALAKGESKVLIGNYSIDLKTNIQTDRSTGNNCIIKRKHFPNYRGEEIYICGKKEKLPEIKEKLNEVLTANRKKKILPFSEIMDESIIKMIADICNCTYYIYQDNDFASLKSLVIEGTENNVNRMVELLEKYI